MSPGLGARLRRCGAVLACLSVLGCEWGSDRAFLLEVEDVGPSVLERGATLVVAGAGFPEGVTGDLTLAGEVFAPGAEPRAVEIDVAVTSESRTRARSPIAERDLDRLLRGAEHVTFRGRALLTFAPRRSMAPLVGESSELVLDVFSVRSEPRLERSPFAEHLGLTIGADLRVQAIEPGSIAEQAGLALGDQLKGLDGVRLDTAADFVPRPHARVSVAALERGEENLEVALDRAGFEPGLSDLGTRVAVWIACALFGLLVAVRPPRGLVNGIRRKAPAPLAGRSAAPASEDPGLWFRHTTFGLVSALLWVSLSRSSFFAARVDLLVVFVAVVFADAAASVLLGGACASRYSLSRALRALGRAALLGAPIAGAFALRSFETGTLSASDLLRTNLAAPLGFGLLSSPWTLVVGALYWVGTVARHRVPRAARSRGLVGVGRGFEWLSLVLKAALWVLLFARMPSVGREPSGLLLALALALGLLFALGLRRAIGTPTPALVLAWLSRSFFVVGLMCAVAGVGASVLAPKIAFAAELGTGALVMAGAALLSGVLVWIRSRHASERLVDPWV